ncbi:MAG: peptidylprolyl isomerase, partial [Ilumatobacteraceae bacterium]
MIRRRVVPLLIAASLALGACGTFTDDDAAAQVDGEVLSHADFDRLANAAVGEPDPADDGTVEVPMGTARDVLNTWIVTQIVEADVVGAGGSPAEPVDGPDAFQALLAEQEALFEQWLELDGASDEKFRAAYERGPEQSEVVCTAHVLVDERAEAEAVLDELDAGADFADVAAERSTDEGSAADGGNLPCATIVDFQNQYIPEYVDAALDAEVGVPTEPVESSFGWHVILVRPFDDIADDPDARALFD